MVFKCTPSANGLRDRHPESIEAVLWKQELQDLLDILEVSYGCLWVPRSLNYPQGALEPDGVFVAGGDEQQTGCLSNMRIDKPSNGYRRPTLAEPRVAGEEALQTLISGNIPRDELSSLIEAVVSNAKAAEMVSLLRGNDAQVFVDAANEVQCHSSILRNGMIYFVLDLLHFGRRWEVLTLPNTFEINA